MKTRLFTLGSLILLCLAPLGAQATVVLQDDFSYPDGALTNVANTKWFVHSGAVGSVEVVSGRVALSQSRAQDVNALLEGGPYLASGSTNILYASFTVNFAALPTGSAGFFFAHFKDGGTGFRCRIYATTNGAASGSFRLGVASQATSAAATWTTDLGLNTTYLVVCRTFLNGAASTLWIDPVNEVSTSVTATDNAQNFTAVAYAFRQPGSSAAGATTLTVDDLLVGTTFAEVVPGSVNPPVVVVEPQDTNVIAGSNATFSVTAAGDPPLGYQWQFNGTDITWGTGATLILTNVTTNQAGSYAARITNAAGATNTRNATLTVDAVPIAPFITNQPESQTVILGSSVTFAVGAGGSTPLTYRWTFNSTNLPGATSSRLTLSNVSSNEAGPYQVMITNVAGWATSTVATLVVIPPPTVNIADLHASVDPVNYRPTNTTALFTAEGIVTTHENLTSGTNALFYMQDATAGIAVYWAGNVLANLPHAGDRVRVIAPLTSYQGLLEMAPVLSSPLHSVTLLSTSNPLPAPQPVPFDPAPQSNPVIMDPLEGSYLVASDVFIDLTTPTFSGTCLITNAAGNTFTLYANTYTDVAGQTKPAGPVTIFGVLSQYDTSDPRTSGYQLIPSRFADIVSAAKAPTVRFTNVLQNLIRLGDQPTNSFSEHALRPTEKLTMQVTVTDPDGGWVSVTPFSDGLPASASWNCSTTTGTNVTATFTFQPTAAEAGRNYVAALGVANSGVTTTNFWTVYVPTPAEQQVFIGEFLANPTSNPGSPMFNPLRRNPALTNSSDISKYDEYIEIVNLSGSDIEMLGWTVADAIQPRHQFSDYFTLWASNSVVVYGGPLNGNEPGITTPKIPASSGTLALNNSGSELIVLRNYPDSNLVARVAYTGADLSGSGSLARFPTANSAFLPQTLVASQAASPGTQYDGRAWNQPPKMPVAVTNIAITASNIVTLEFVADTNCIHTLWQANRVSEPFRAVLGSQFTNSAGRFVISNLPPVQQYYFISKE